MSDKPFSADLLEALRNYWRDEYNVADAALASVSADLAKAVRERDEARAQLAELREAVEELKKSRDWSVEHYDTKELYAAVDEIEAILARQKGEE